VGREELLLEAALLDHELEVDVDVLAALQVVVLLLLLLPLRLLHLQPPLLPVLLDLLDLVQVAAALLLTSLHI
jgi:hypothetical protein